MMTFNEYTDTWFEKFSEEKIKKDTLAKFRKLLSRKIVDHRAVNRLRELTNLLSVEVAVPLVAHIDALNNKEFGDEFRYTYSKYPDPPQVSAASCLFSQIQQAIEYYRVGYYAKP